MNTISAMPILTRDPKSVWAKSAQVRNWIYDKVEESCNNLGIEALVNKSNDFVYPAWVSLEAWLPAGAPGATHRLFCTFSIDPKPHSQFEFELTVRCDRDGKRKIYGPYQPVAGNHVDEWVRYILDKAGKPSINRLRIRKHPWQLWYPKNKAPRIGYDFIAMGGVVGLVIAWMGLSVASAGPLIAAIVVLAGLGVAGACFYMRWGRRKAVINAGQPIAQPRTLRIVDSWQTMINDLGRNWESVRTKLFRRLADGQAFSIEPRLENISYLTPDGKQERQQLVLTQGRGLVFCHVYPYGDDVYIGWEAYINYGQWVERQLVSGFDQNLGMPTVINTVTPGIARVTEYDLIDLNSLTEWAHSRIVQVIKQLLAEHKLDQEIDFKILQRGERTSLVNHSEMQTRRPLFRRGATSDPSGGPSTFSGATP